MNQKRPGRAAYKALKMEMTNCMYEQQDIANMLERSKAYVSRRMNGEETFEIEEAYKILEMLQLPENLFTEIFPRDPFQRVTTTYRARRAQ